MDWAELGRVRFVCGRCRLCSVGPSRGQGYGLEESTCTDGKEGGVVDTEVPRERYGVEEEWVAACGDVDCLAVLG